MSEKRSTFWNSSQSPFGTELYHCAFRTDPVSSLQALTVHPQPPPLAALTLQLTEALKSHEGQGGEGGYSRRPLHRALGDVFSCLGGEPPGTLDGEGAVQQWHKSEGGGGRGQPGAIGLSLLAWILFVAGMKKQGKTCSVFQHLRNFWNPEPHACQAGPLLLSYIFDSQLLKRRFDYMQTCAPYISELRPLLPSFA